MYVRSAPKLRSQGGLLGMTYIRPKDTQALVRQTWRRPETLSERGNDDMCRLDSKEK